MPTTSRLERVHFRLAAQKKELIERAASLQGLSVTDFAIQVLCREAQSVIQQAEGLVLSDRDRDAFLAALDSPPKPTNWALKAAAQVKRSRIRRAI